MEEPENGTMIHVHRETRSAYVYTCRTLAPSSVWPSVTEMTDRTRENRSEKLTRPACK